MPLPTVTIVGRINTGKSTLFNRLTGTQKAITSSIPETTRDRIIEKVSWDRYQFNLVDTGGVDIEHLKNSIMLLREKKFPRSSGIIEREVIKQTKKALSDADVILFLVDSKSGLMKQDKDLAKILRTIKKDILLVCNKVDSQKYAHRISEFYALGFSDPIPVSAINGSGTGDLLDIIISTLKKRKKIEHAAETPDTDFAIRVSFIGKPSVGKSSLLNSILGEERVIVSPVPQTTREPQDIEFEYKGTKIILVDTAGLKKKRKTEPGLDSISSERTMEAVQKSDIVLFVLNVGEPLVGQDVRLAGMLAESSASIILVANKWDITPNKDASTSKKFIDYIRKMLHPLDWAPIIFTSAKTGQNVKKILDLILGVCERRKTVIAESTLNTLLKKLIKTKRPYGGTGLEKPRIRAIRQKKTNPPEFTIQLGHDQTLHQGYVRFIENTMRKEFDLEGVSIKIKVQSSK